MHPSKISLYGKGLNFTAKLLPQSETRAITKGD